MDRSIKRINLAPEERFLWECARDWRKAALPKAVQDLDWSRLLEVVETNRAARLVERFLERAHGLEVLPGEQREQLREGSAALAGTAAKMAGALQRYLRLAAARGVDTVVMKGLAVSTDVHGDPAIRPGSDIDILVHEGQVGDALEILAEMGFGRWWPKLMEDAYYARHHLHQLRCDPSTEIWVEVHWTLDHPYTLLTMDMNALLDRTTTGELLGEPVRQLALPDWLLSLAVHLVKHAVYLPNALHRPDLARVILADGMLIYYLDVAEIVKQHADEIDWDLTVKIAEEWGATTILGAVLRVCREFLDAPVPDRTLAALPINAPGGVTGWAMERMADHEIAAYEKRNTSPIWDLLLSTNEALILRPIRILDTAAFFFPGKGYLRRRYGSTSMATALRHLGHAVIEYGRLGLDSIYYGWKRRERMRFHDRHGYLPDTGPKPNSQRTD